MRRLKRIIAISARIWFFSSLFLAIGSIFFLLIEFPKEWWGFIPVFIISLILTVPVFILLIIASLLLVRSSLLTQQKIWLLMFCCVSSSVGYAIVAAALKEGTSLYDFRDLSWLPEAVLFSGILIICSLVSFQLSKKQLLNFFLSESIPFKHFQQHNMETLNPSPRSATKTNTLIKAIITGCLILLLMIPTLLISNLVSEREKRNDAVVAEVSNMWASSQTISGPFIYVPYTTSFKNDRGILEEVYQHFWLMPEDLNVTGNVSHLIRQKSIYKVMLFRANLKSEGKIKFQIPKEITPASVLWQDIKICYGLSDFKGIEEKIIITANDQSLEFSPGLPSKDLVPEGLSAPITISETDIGHVINFTMPLKLKGSERLHFIPLSGNSTYQLTSSWHSPSFDGNNLPAERNISSAGFSASWKFNKANLPFNTMLTSVGFEPAKFAFGVSLLQPTDQYVKTDRSVKYAILFISLTFALFFIIELLQKKPIHPVQYALIGLALVIFYTLLLSISEFIEFDTSYMIAAAATISLITWYSALHFRKWLPSLVLCSALTTLYVFIFVLIRLEDTALLFGSIGLFIILAVAMYFSKRVNWYGGNDTTVLQPSGA